MEGWFRKKMDEGYPEEDAFYERLGRRSGPVDGLEKGDPEAPEFSNWYASPTGSEHLSLWHLGLDHCP